MSVNRIRNLFYTLFSPPKDEILVSIRFFLLVFVSPYYLCWYMNILNRVMGWPGCLLLPQFSAYIVKYHWGKEWLKLNWAWPDGCRCQYFTNDSKHSSYQYITYVKGRNSHAYELRYPRNGHMGKFIVTMDETYFGKKISWNVFKMVYEGAHGRPF